MIVQLGERTVANLDDYMAAFGTMEPNKPCRVVVERQGETLELEIVPDPPRPSR